MAEKKQPWSLTLPRIYGASNTDYVTVKRNELVSIINRAAKEIEDLRAQVKLYRDCIK